MYLYVEAIHTMNIESCSLMITDIKVACVYETTKPQVYFLLLSQTFWSPVLMKDQCSGQVITSTISEQMWSPNIAMKLYCSTNTHVMNYHLII